MSVLKLDKESTASNKQIVFLLLSMLAVPAVLAAVNYDYNQPGAAISGLVLYAVMTVAWLILYVRLKPGSKGVVGGRWMIATVICAILADVPRVICGSTLIITKITGVIAPYWMAAIVTGTPYIQIVRTINVAAILSILWAIQSSVFRELGSLKHLSERDSLTELLNPNSFISCLDKAMEKASIIDQSLSVIMIDIDHFKNYNDSYGHPAGDELLKQLARLLEGHTRQGDIVGRIGGEEFALVLPGARKDAACMVAERIRRAVEQFTFPRQKMTISLGVAQFPNDAQDRTTLVDLADRALYHAKITGRNRLYHWGQGGQEDGLPQCNIPKRRLLFVGHDTNAREACVKAGETTPTTDANIALEILKKSAFDAIVAEAKVFTLHFRQKAAKIRPDAVTILLAEGISPDEVDSAADVVDHKSLAELSIVLERHFYSRESERSDVLNNSKRLLFEALKSVVSAMDAKDEYNIGHSKRVAELSIAIADALGLPPAERYAVELAAELHDIGKVALPDEVLHKEGKLTDEDWAVIRSHPSKGSEIVAAVPGLTYVAGIVRHHHERLDGRGYPDGLSGDAIPLAARILAVAEAFETMTSVQPRRSKFRTPAEAIAEFRVNEGHEFDPRVIDALEKALQVNDSRHPIAA